MEFKKYDNELINEGYLHTVLNGLNILVIPKKKFKSKYAIYGTKYGSVNNKFIFKNNNYNVPEGIAHFLEHKMFEKPNGDAFSRYAKTGAQANAYTSFDMTAYLFSCTENFYESLDILADIINTPWFTEQTVKKEQGIIGREIEMGLDNPGSRCFYNLMKCLYKNHPIRYDIAGSIESISKITPELLYTCYEAFYNPSNMVLCVCGDIDEQRVLEIVEKRMKNVVPEKVENIYENEPQEINEPKKVMKAEVSIPQFQIGIKDKRTGLYGIELSKHRIVTDMIIDAMVGRSTAFYSRLYDEGLINGKFSGGSVCMQSCGFFEFTGESDNPYKVYDEIQKEINKFNKSGITDENFKRLKNKNYGFLLNVFDDTDDLANEYLSAFFDGITIFDMLQIYADLTVDDINEELKYFDLNKMAISIVEPN
jgi:predicted Zn-dependent peptidase